MNKNLKISIQIIILAVLIGGLAFYFYTQFNINKEKESSEAFELSEIKFEPAEDLDPALKKKYAERFIKIGNAINENRDDLEAWLALGGVFKVIKNYEMTEKIWLYTAQKWPEDPVAFGNLGDLYSNFLPDYTKAEWALKEAIKASSGIAEHLIYYRNLHDLYKYYYTEKADLADDIILDALEKYPNEPDFLVTLAVYYRDMKDKEKAIEYFEKLLEIDPTNQAAKRDLELLKNEP